MSTVQRIAILGAESSGKSTLAAALANHFQTLWVPEYLREFVDTHKRVPIESEQIHIAQTQVARELDMVSRANKFLFCDTTPVMTAIYSRHIFGEADAALAQLELDHQYDFTIVTAPDFPWIADGLQRASAHVQKQIHEEVLQVLDERDIPFLLVEGSLQNRIEQVDFAFSFLLGN
jgi:NadR type nicotinamide-nucleotide adenylyltransferase